MLPEWAQKRIIKQALTVTTYGIPPYGLDDLQKNLPAVLARQPAIVSQFRVEPTCATP